LDKKIVDVLHTGFPLETEPYAKIARELGISEDELMHRVRSLMERGIIRRIAPLLNTQRMGVCSTLIALKVPREQMEKVAERINGYDEVSHNYEREHEYNMWFTVSAPDQRRLEQILSDIRALGYPMLNLPTVKVFKINVRFDIA